jgi:hypothetical protein
MDSVKEIEDAIDRLTPEDFRRISSWFWEKHQQHWDKQLDRDSAAGWLDFLFEEAEQESREGTLREWPPQS